MTNTNTTTYNFTVTGPTGDFHPTIRVADNGTWDINPNGLREAMTEGQWAEWLADAWREIRRA